MAGGKKKSVEDILHVLIIFCLECLESDRVLLFSERHILLRVLPVLVVLATSGEKEGESIFKKIKIPRLLSIFKVNIFMHYLKPFLLILLFFLKFS
jgi:cytoplasmic FMR1 interacting protein